MNIKDAYIHNGEAILKDIQVSGSKLQKLKAGKDANDAYLTWVDVLDFSSFGASGHNHDDLYLKLVGGTLTGDLTLKASSGDSPKIIFQRGTLADSLDDWRIFDTGGNLKFQHTTGSTTDWKDYIIFSATAGTLTINGNTALHSGNYTSYTVKKDGTGATGTWGIDISGNAATATTATNLSAKPSIQAGTSDTSKVTITAGGKTSDEYIIPAATKLYSYTIAASTDLDTIKEFKYYTSSATSTCSSLVNGPDGRSNGEMWFLALPAGSTNYGQQLYYSRASTNWQLWTRTWANTSFSTWVQFIHSGNIGSQSVNYATSSGKVDHKLTFTGGVTGDWDGSANKTVAIPTKSSWNYDDVYLKDLLLDTGNATDKNKSVSLTNGNVYLKLFKTVNGAEAEDSKVKLYGDTNVTVTTDSNGDIKIIGSSSVTNAEQLGGVAASSYFKNRDYAYNSEWTGKFLWTIWDNHLYAADKRFNVTVTGTTSTTFGALFDGCFEGGINITESTAVLHIKHKTTDGNIWTTGLPYGNFYLIFYNSDAENVTGRVYCNYSPQGTGWHDLTVTHIGHVWILSNGYYQLSDLEITITKPASSSSITLCQVLHQVTRSSGPSLAAVMSKYCNQVTDYNITANKFIGPLQGNADSATYTSNVGSAGTAGTNYVTAAKVIATCNWYDAMTGSDTDAVINRWSEIVAFVANFTETPDLATFLSNNYLAKSGGTMTGPIKWTDATALPEQTSPQYFVCIDAFNSGGTTKWASKANTLKALTGLTSTAVGDSDEPVYWDGSKFVKAGAYPTKASWNYDDIYLKLSGGTMTGTIFSGNGVVQIWRGSATSGSAGYNAYLAYNSGNVYLATFGSVNSGKSVYLETYDTDVYHRKNTTNYKIWDESNDGSGSGLDADLLDGNHASDFALAENTYGTTGNFVNGIATSNYVARGDLGLVGFDNSPITVELYEAASGSSYPSSPTKTITVADATYGVNFRKGAQATMHTCAAGAKLKIIVKSSGNYIKAVGIYVGAGGNTISFSSTVGSTTKTGSFNTYGSWHIFSCMHSTPSSITLELNTTNVNYGIIIGGFRTYITNPSQLRFPGVANSAESVSWSNITNKPSTFPVATHNHDDVYLKLTGGTLTDVLTLKAGAYAVDNTWTYPGGSYRSVQKPNLRLIGDSTYGLSTIEFISQKGDTSINKPSDCAFIQFQPYGTGTLAAIGSAPTLNTSGEVNRLVIGVSNDSNDILVLQTPATTGLKHVVATNSYTIWDAGNDGSGSGLDADLLDGFHAADFRNNIVDLRTNPQTFNPTYLKDIVFISEADYTTLVSNGTITKNSITHTYNASNWYVIEDKVPEYAATAGNANYASVAGLISMSTNSLNAWNPVPYLASGDANAALYKSFNFQVRPARGALFIGTDTTGISDFLSSSSYQGSVWIGTKNSGILLDSQDNLIIENYAGNAIKFAIDAPVNIEFYNDYEGDWAYLSAYLDWSYVTNKPDWVTCTNQSSTASYSLYSGGWTQTINLPTTKGSYILQLSTGSGNTESYLTGMFSISGGDTAKDEISLHLHGKGKRLYARTNGTKLELSSNDATATSVSVTIKYRRMI